MKKKEKVKKLVNKSRIAKEISRTHTCEGKLFCNRHNLVLWLNKRGIDIRNTSKAFLNNAVDGVKNILNKNVEVGGEKLFGVRTKRGTSALILEYISSIVDEMDNSERCFSGVKKDKAAILKEEYKKLFGQQPEDGLSVKQMRLRIRRQKLSVASKTISASKSQCLNDFQSRIRKKRVLKSTRSVLGRLVGCNLDEQAKELGIYSEEYSQLSRAKRKRLNHKAYKKQIS